MPGSSAQPNHTRSTKQPKHTTQPMPIMKHPETAQETARRPGSPNNWCVSATLSCLRTRSTKHVQERSPTHVNVRAAYIPTPISFPRHGMGTDLIHRGGFCLPQPMPCLAFPWAASPHAQAATGSCLAQASAREAMPPTNKHKTTPMACPSTRLGRSSTISAAASQLSSSPPLKRLIDNFWTGTSRHHTPLSLHTMVF